MKRTKIIGEIGINAFYGEHKEEFLPNALKLIDVAIIAGCDYVKFQKRTPDICVPQEQKNKLKSVPWVKDKQITYLQYKNPPLCRLPSACKRRPRLCPIYTAMA